MKNTCSNRYILFRQIDKLKQPDRQRIISRIGKIAFFTRLIRRFARSPNVGQVDFEHFFPKPELAFHRKLFLNCRSDIVVSF
jgi:hypothetical protein